ncbi:MAG: WD40/YVTN/BNR-like repeat-containing protein [Candidatus Hodarchaeota archaeon]
MSNYWFLTEIGILDEKGIPVADIPFQGKPVIHGNIQDNQVAVIVDRRELWTFVDGHWFNQVSSDLKLNCVLWTPKNEILLGTATARLAWGNGDGLEFIQSFDQVKERSLWNTPWGGPPDVRSLTLGADGTLYANVHVGWIVRSTDGGNSWEITRDGLEKDVHHVSAHPKNPKIVFAATAWGFHISYDRGTQFLRRWDHIPQNYQRTTMCFPDEEVYLASVANNSSGGNATLYRSKDEGKTWANVKGLPSSVQANINTFQLIGLPGGHGLMILENTKLYETKDYGKTWMGSTLDLPKVYQILPLKE